ncbi:hypothetical protein QDA02_gp26 [Microbacterium phage Margaery]|uniref:Uncharacterized protein n=1 Tax=Microbacterium phage Margaery TaxID=2591217 RepID=A0A514DHQ2_9CAUD|nr:hypothetical protein QDA02_gp26 [Microbacterium phage Margaery]QDH93139.1 hypothetical protein PBI_MARGAERY_82 [Microbacterium phage Margaery]
MDCEHGIPIPPHTNRPDEIDQVVRERLGPTMDTTARTVSMEEKHDDD